jgi:hypothetical protein
MVAVVLDYEKQFKIFQNKNGSQFLSKTID